MKFFSIEVADRLNGKSFEDPFRSVHGTNFMINEPKPFDKSWYIHKFDGTGVRQDIGVSIEIPE